MSSEPSIDIEQALGRLRLGDHNLHHAASATRLLAERSRSDGDVRAALAEPSTLKLLLDIVKSGLSHSLDDSAAALRCIGNACIDNDAARDALTGLGFTWAVQCLALGDETLKTLTIKALFNICLDYEAAQKACLDHHVHYRLLQFLRDAATSAQQSVDAHDDDGSLELAADLLFVICGHKTAEDRDEALPVDVIENLLLLPISDPILPRVGGLDGFATLAETALVFLRDTSVQMQVIENQFFAALWDVFMSVQAQLRIVNRDATSDDPPGAQDAAEGSRQLLIPLSASFTWILSDIAAIKSFVGHYPIHNPLMQELVRIIVATKSSDVKPGPAACESTERVANAACQVIGNLLWLHEPQHYASLVLSPEAGDLAPTMPVHTALFAILVETQGIDLLHSAAGVLVQLTRPSVQCREVLGSDSLSTPALARLCAHERSEMQQDALKLLKAMGKDCPANQAKFTRLARDVMTSLSSMAQQNHSAAGGAAAVPTEVEKADSLMLDGNA